MDLKDILKPSTIEEALRVKSSLEHGLFLAGGTDLIIKLSKKDINTEYLIDLNSIEDLKKITESDSYIEIGSMITFSELREDSIIKKYFNLLTECAETMGSPQIRNMATIGGNIVNAGPAADGVPCIMALDGVLVFKSLSKLRTTTCLEYFENYANEKIKDDELLIKILIPKKNILSSFYKLGKRNSLSIARLSTSITLNVENNIINNISIALGAVGRYPIRAKKIEDKAIGKNISWLFEEEPLIMLENEVIDSIKGRKTMPFKKEAIKGVYKNALRRALSLDENERGI
ncbi:Nicotinate dehydrogenase FAD-subunit [uncultured Clostridium sp.]|uniref:FAD binding domain-containing protein n=1 Tax=uncultured Clostridium sp. TaxID=59620 RepID=UPI0008230F12|nr:FAD binding domain-containing protein [uncultured Clostridium sp.]SCK04362.1 Nicotinate dehydrogenase FAD-subunit [uncultured Clostridium sp.]